MSDGAKAGTCGTCGRDLVQVPGDRTYQADKDQTCIPNPYRRGC